MDYRIEMKFICNMKDYVIMKSRIGEIMELDSHVEDTDYLVRSIYFDDYDHSCYFSNETGIDNREKFRIRTYNHNADKIKLELKSKKNGYTHKESAILTKQKAEELIKGNMIFHKDQHPLLNKLYLKNQMNLMKSSVIIEYNREPYIYKLGNVRVTFDRFITASLDSESFFEETIKTVPVLQTGQFILEVKYDEILPNEIYAILNSGNFNQTTFSKFYLGKKCMGVSNAFF